MQASNAPTKSAVPFANSGAKNTIPVASQIGITPGLASVTDGFPPLTMTPLAAGGVPPYGQDFNGILNFLSSAVRWAQPGGGYVYDAAFATAAGGYPRGAILLKAGLNGIWVSTAENNTGNRIQVERVGSTAMQPQFPLALGRKRRMRSSLARHSVTDRHGSILRQAGLRESPTPTAPANQS